jgi:hypothetical protein
MKKVKLDRAETGVRGMYQMFHTHFTAHHPTLYAQMYIVPESGRLIRSGAFRSLLISCEISYIIIMCKSKRRSVTIRGQKLNAFNFSNLLDIWLFLAVYLIILFYFIPWNCHFCG